MKPLRVPLLLAALAAFLLPAPGRAERPGHHASYLHALTDLHAAREHLRNRGGNGEMVWDERKAVTEVDAAIRDLEDAALEVGKNIRELPGVDVRKEDVGELHRALDLLRKARQNASEREDDDRADDLRRRAAFHIDEAIHFTEEGLADGAPPPPPPPPPEESYADDPGDEALDEEVTFESPEDGDDTDEYAIFEEPPVEPPEPIAVRYLPPPMRYEPPPPMPENGMYWVGGYWVWHDGGWMWMSGHWLLPPRPGYGWAPPYYEVRGEVVVFVTGHWGPPGYVFRPPATYRFVSAPRPRYRGTLVVAGVSRGVFVPPPPGSRRGLVIPAPLGTPPQVVVGAPPVVRPGMIIRGGVQHTTFISNTTVSNVTVFAPAGVTKNGRAINSSVPTRPWLAASLPPRAAVAPPPPPASAIAAHPTAFSPFATRPSRPGQRVMLPPTVSAHPSNETIILRERPVRRPHGDNPPAGNAQPAGNAPPPGNNPPGGDAPGRHGDRDRGDREPGRNPAQDGKAPPKLEPASTPTTTTPPPPAGNVPAGRGGDKDRVDRNLGDREPGRTPSPDGKPPRLDPNATPTTTTPPPPSTTPAGTVPGGRAGDRERADRERTDRVPGRTPTPDGKPQKIEPATPATTPPPSSKPITVTQPPAKREELQRPNRELRRGEGRGDAKLERVKDKDKDKEKDDKDKLRKRP
jgi:hypothetical protein